MAGSTVQFSKKSCNLPELKNITDLGMGSENKNKKNTRFLFLFQRHNTISYWLLILWYALKKDGTAIIIPIL